MKTYELTYIVSPKLSSTEADKEAKEVESLIQSKEGVVLVSEKVSIRTMAYPIKKQASGYFGNLTFQIEENKVKEVKEKLEKNGSILRHLITVKMPTRFIKERRTRRPAIFKERQTALRYSAVDNKKADEKLDVESLDKKLDELLSG
mgnify:CR=1 FL=1